MTMLTYLKKLFSSVTLEDVALREAQDLDRRILNEELRRIDHNHLIDACLRKKQFLLDWLSRDTPNSMKNHDN